MDNAIQITITGFGLFVTLVIAMAIVIGVSAVIYRAVEK